GWGATGISYHSLSNDLVSIHAPRVGRDIAALTKYSRAYGFNPRAPGGARPAMLLVRPYLAKFQSTRPGWGATGGARRNPGRDTRFNPRAPGGARQANPENHLPGMLFQSTRPGWGAT